MKRTIIPAIFLSLFSYILFIHFYYLDGIPHVPDDAAYVFMAKMLTHGMINTPIPIPAAAVDFFPGILDVTHNTWLFQYPFGHPLLLAIGFFLKVPHLIMPFIAVLTIFLLYKIAQTMYTKTASYFLLFLPFLSPFFLENSASFMGHTTAAFYLTCSLFYYVFFRKQFSFWYVFLSGVFLGLLFNTRPLTCFPFFFIFLLLFLQKKTKRIQVLLSYISGFGLLLMLWCLYNLKTTGNPFSSQYLLVNQDLFGIHDTVTFSAFFLKRVTNMSILFKNFIPMLFNLPFILTLFLLGISLLKKPVRKFTIFLYGCIFLLPLVYFFYNGTFLMYGPRFWYESLPFVFLLVSYGLSILYTRYKTYVLVFCVLLTVMSLGRFFSLIPVTSPDFFSPLQASALKGFNFIDTRILYRVQAANIHHAVVFVDDCQGNWWCYGSVFSENNPTLTSDVVYVKYNGRTNAVVQNHFRGRKFYEIDYNHPVLSQIK